MKEKIKKMIFGYLPGFVLGVITAISISVIAATYFPSKDVTYDNKESGLTSTDVQGAIDEYKDEYEEGKYTYKGANPNNYVTFNNEKAGWRIISINSDGTIKIMKDASIGDIAWDTTGGTWGSNNWNRPADLNTYLNGDYYNSLFSTAQSQIVEATYYAGAVTYYNNNDMQDQINDEKAVTSKVKIALPTLSEYLRANSNKEQCGTYSLNNSNYSTCKNSDWMYINDYWWTLSPSSGGSSSVFIVSSIGSVSYNSANHG